MREEEQKIPHSVEDFSDLMKEGFRKRDEEQAASKELIGDDNEGFFDNGLFRALEIERTAKQDLAFGIADAIPNLIESGLGVMTSPIDFIGSQLNDHYEGDIKAARAYRKAQQIAAQDKKVKERGGTPIEQETPINLTPEQDELFERGPEGRWQTKEDTTLLLKPMPNPGKAKIIGEKEKHPMSDFGIPAIDIWGDDTEKLRERNRQILSTSDISEFYELGYTDEDIKKFEDGALAIPAHYEFVSINSLSEQQREALGDNIYNGLNDWLDSSRDLTERGVTNILMPNAVDAGRFESSPMYWLGNEGTKLISRWAATLLISRPLLGFANKGISIPIGKINLKILDNIRTATAKRVKQMSYVRAMQKGRPIADSRMKERVILDGRKPIAMELNVYNPWAAGRDISTMRDIITFTMVDQALRLPDGEHSENIATSLLLIMVGKGITGSTGIGGWLNRRKFGELFFPKYGMKRPTMDKELSPGYLKLNPGLKELTP